MTLFSLSLHINNIVQPVNQKMCECTEAVEPLLLRSVWYQALFSFSRCTRIVSIWKCVIYIVGVGGEEGVIRGGPGWWRVVVHDSTIGCAGRYVIASVGILNENKKRKKIQETVKMHWIYLTLQRKCTFYFFMFVLRK